MPVQISTKDNRPVNTAGGFSISFNASSRTVYTSAMPHNRGSPDDHEHSHSHDDNCHEELSNKYKEYIDAHPEKLRTKCAHINVCIDMLLEDVDPMTVLNGYNLNLNKTCSLVYKYRDKIYSNLSSKCTAQDRNDIRDDIELHLKHEVEDNRNKTGWKSLKKCLVNNYGTTDNFPYVDKICGLAHNKTQICANTSHVHGVIETFFNDQIQHLKCTCRAFQIEEASGISLPIMIAAAAGGVLLVLALFAIGFICYRRRKSKKRKQKALNVIYVQAPSSDNCPVYQEIFDDRGFKSYKQSPSLGPPTLPTRYTPSSSKPSHQAHLVVQEDSHGYMEPGEASARLRPQLPIPGNSNPGYEAPPEYREIDATDKENSYCEPVPSATEDEEDKSYDTQGPSKSEGVSSNPIPAKRTQINGQQRESTYFVLESAPDS